MNAQKNEWPTTIKWAFTVVVLTVSVWLLVLLYSWAKVDIG